MVYNQVKNDPKNANLEISNNETAFGSITCNALISNTSIQCGDLTASALYGGAVVQIQQNIDNAISAAAFNSAFVASLPVSF